jgi:hypothetical protein
VSSVCAARGKAFLLRAEGLSPAVMMKFENPEFDPWLLIIIISDPQLSWFVKVGEMLGGFDSKP